MTLNSQDFLKETGRLREPAPENGTSRAAPGRSALPVSSVGLGLVVSRDPHVGPMATQQLGHSSHLLANMLAVHRLRPLTFHSHPRLLSRSRSMASKPPLGRRPAPHPLPPAQQREFEALQRQAEVAAVANAPAGRAERHPDAPVPLNADFDGDVNPATGERGGPKREPVRRWIEHEGDWSFKGRVSDF
jgi:hypothetical protein